MLLNRAETILMNNPIRSTIRHPRENRFDHAGLLEGLREVGFVIRADDAWSDVFGFFVADRRVE